MMGKLLYIEMRLVYGEINKVCKITKENLELVCEVQNSIFPEGDARENYIKMVNQLIYGTIKF